MAVREKGKHDDDTILYRRNGSSSRNWKENAEFGEEQGVQKVGGHLN